MLFELPLLASPMDTMGFLVPRPGTGKGFLKKFSHSEEYGFKEKWLLAKERLQVTNSPVHSRSCTWILLFGSLFYYLESIYVVQLQ